MPLRGLPKGPEQNVQSRRAVRMRRLFYFRHEARTPHLAATCRVACDSLRGPQSMNEHLRDRIVRKLDTLADERGYQILDYVEFLESKYAEKQSSGTTAFTRFTEAVEDRLRAGKVSASTITEAMNLMNRASNVLNGALAAGRSVANDIVTATRTPTPNQSVATTQPAPSSNGPSSTEASSPARDTKVPGSGEEKL